MLMRDRILDLHAILVCAYAKLRKYR